MEFPKLKEVLNLDITVSADNVEDDLFKIYSQILKGVKREDLAFEELKGGMVNSNFRTFLKYDKSKSLVFRTFGFKLNAEAFKKDVQKEDEKNGQVKNQAKDATDEKTPTNTNEEGFDVSAAFFNRLTEFAVMNEVSKYGLCQPVYAKFTNGICYGYAEGVTANGPLMLTNDFLSEMATKLSRLHSIKFEIPGIKFKTHYERMCFQLDAMAKQLVGNFDQIIKEANEFPYNVYPSIDSLVKEEKKITDILDRIGMGTIGFCHNDLNQRNIIWNPQDRNLSFIDFEMTMNNYDTIEIGQLFTCYSGHFLDDFNGDHFPSEEYRKRFLRLYLEEKNRVNQIRKPEKEIENDLQKLFIQTNLTSLIFMIKSISTVPLLDFRPDFYKNSDLEERRKTEKYNFGKFGYAVYQFYAIIKDEFIKSGEAYLEAQKNEKIEKIEK